MDLRKEMAQSIYLSGGMSRIPGIKQRLEKELKKLFPSALKVQVKQDK
jgi:actin-related protein